MVTKLLFGGVPMPIQQLTTITKKAARLCAVRFILLASCVPLVLAGCSKVGKEGAAQVKLEFVPDSKDLGDQVVSDLDRSDPRKWTFTVEARKPCLCPQDTLGYRLYDRSGKKISQGTVHHPLYSNIDGPVKCFFTDSALGDGVDRVVIGPRGMGAFDPWIEP
jgi:hypothetical protein